MSTPDPTTPAPAAPAAPATPSTSAAMTTPTPAAPAPAAAAPTTPPSGASAADWTTGLNDDLKGWIGNKGFKGPEELANSYRNLEKLMGSQDKLVKLPDSFYDDKGKLTAEGRQVYERLGAPKEAKDYNVDVPKEGGDPKLAEHFRQIFHEAGLPKQTAESIVKNWNEYQAQAKAQAVEAASNAFKQQETQLKTDWGMAYDQNVNIAKEAVRVMGLNAQQIDAIAASIGHAETLKLFNKFGKATAEAPFVGGSKPDAIHEPANAQAKIKELKSDREFGNRLMNGEAQAKKLWDDLHKQAFPGEHRIS